MSNFKNWPSYKARRSESYRAKQKKWMANWLNSEKGKAYEIEYTNSGRRIAQVRKYQATENGILKRNARLKIRRATDPAFRIKVNLRTRIWYSLKGLQRFASFKNLIGCEPNELRDYLESLFSQGMSWSNYGKVWEIDHIKPCATFDLIDPGQQKLCYHFSNLQPLWKRDNRVKQGKWSPAWRQSTMILSPKK